MSARTIIRTVVTPRTVTRRVGPAGADAEGGGVSSFTDLTDKASADLPAINGPLASALSGKAPASGISPSAITGTAVITTDPRLSDARTPTAHTHVSADITDATSAATPGTVVLRNAGGGAAFAGLNTNSGSYSQTGGANFNVAVTTAANLTATGAGTVTVSGAAGTTISGGMLTFSPSGFSYGAGKEVLHRTALGSGATGDELFQAATPAAARTTLGFDGLVRKVPFTISLESDFTTSSTSFVHVTGLSFTIEANKRYAVSYYLLTNKNDSSGVAAQFTGPASPSKVLIRQVVGITSFTNAVGNVISDFSTSPATFNTFNGDSFMTAAAGLIANGLNAGTVQLQLRAVTGGTARIYAGSYLQVTEL